MEFSAGGGILREGEFSGGELFAKRGGILRGGTCTGGNPSHTGTGTGAERVDCCIPAGNNAVFLDRTFCTLVLAQERKLRLRVTILYCSDHPDAKMTIEIGVTSTWRKNLHNIQPIFCVLYSYGLFKIMEFNKTSLPALLM